MAANHSFEARVNSRLLAKAREIAATEGREVESVIDEALTDLIAKKKQGSPRSEVMEHFQASVDEFGTLYELFAK